ncbi:hypothetical protein [Candidatus Symbiopectobacterium endolongispinus]|uniref:hypothetical protein n=1 Tax=Candidatus Symbiopectobacterium endolongispinus TaxID=2812664 RepID=UPI002079DA34|nr:hypothetical protein [Candidatus Symbiopectobacterium endolongispinus]MBT9430219.1 hypothetical protein [Candidatus Symbiopectobacterium endolongispinus]
MLLRPLLILLELTPQLLLLLATALNVLIQPLLLQLLVLLHLLLQALLAGNTVFKLLLLGGEPLRICLRAQRHQGQTKYRNQITGHDTYLLYTVYVSGRKTSRHVV